MNKHRKIIYSFILLAVAISATALFLIDQRYKVIVTNVPKKSSTKTPNITPEQPKPLASSTPNSEFAIPHSLLLPVPFTSQAPTANWSDKIYQDGCEEASAIMANEYFKDNHQENLEKTFVLNEIKRLATWEKENFGYNFDINTKETTEMIEKVYGLKTQILENFSEEDIKKQLSENKLVLFPAQGQLLGNPNYKPPGPPYHMLLIKGYTKEGFVTNDPGTKNGRNYAYTFETLYNANGDFTHETEKVDTTKKMLIVIWK